MATKKTKAVEIQGKELYATADFEIQGVEVKAGDKFTPPLGWNRNTEHEEFLLASKQKNSSQVGMVFSYLGEIVNPSEKNPQLRERRVHNAILPLEAR